MGSAAADIRCALVRPMPRVPAARRRMIPRAGARHGHARTHGYPYSTEPRITHIDRAIIRAYFRQVGSMAAQTAQEFQPELRTRLTAVQPLTPQLQMASLPNELEQKLSVLAAGYQRLQAGSELLLIETASGKVIDVLQDIHTPI
jgi:hypothetical protein